MRAFTAAQKALLRSEHIKGNLLATFYLDEGVFRFCDDHVDLSDGTYTYIGASALSDAAEVRSGTDLAAESTTLVVDGNRMAQAGIPDPAHVLRDIMAYLFQQRRVDYALGLSYPTSQEVSLVIPLYAGKINSIRLVDPEIDAEADEPVFGRLEIVLDSLAARYSRATWRTRSQEDQHEIDPTDDFFSYTVDAVNSERQLYWGKATPRTGAVGGNGGGAGGSLGRYNYARQRTEY